MIQDGAFGRVEQVIPVGFASPYQVHREALYLIQGQASFVLNSRWLKAGPGAFVFGRRDIPHGFRVEGTAPANALQSRTEFRGTRVEAHPTTLCP